MKKVLFIIVILIVLVACELKPGYIDSRQKYGVVKTVNLAKLDVNGEIYYYHAKWSEIAPGDTIVYVIRNYKRDNSKILLVKSVNGSVIK